MIQKKTEKNGGREFFGEKNKIANTIWNNWYYCDRFLGKPYPFIDNYPKPKINKNNEEIKEDKKKSQLETKVKST